MIIGISGDRKLSRTQGLIQSDNYRMMHVCTELGFRIESVDANTVKATLELS